MDAEKCISCGDVVPEGTWVCQSCICQSSVSLIDSAIESLKEAQASIKNALVKLTLSGRRDS